MKYHVTTSEAVPKIMEEGMSDEEALEDIMLTYDYGIYEAEMKG